MSQWSLVVKKLIKGVLIALVVLVVLFVVVGLILPTSYEVRRGIAIDAPAGAVFEWVDDLERWPQWEPWREADPTIRVTLDETTRGLGARQSWTGDSGTGELIFTKSDPGSGIAYDMVFDGKYKSKGAVTYHTEGDGSTHVEWVMSGDTGTPIVGGYFALLMDPMVGPMFERGLEKLKAAAEADSAGEVDTQPEPS